MTTSTAAKHKMDTTGTTEAHEQMIYEALCFIRHGNAQDIAQRTGLNSVEVTRRLAKMQEAGRIFKTKVTTPSKLNGNSMHVWALRGVNKIVIEL